MEKYLEPNTSRNKKKQIKHNPDISKDCTIDF